MYLISFGYWFLANNPTNPKSIMFKEYYSYLNHITMVLQVFIGSSWDPLHLSGTIDKVYIRINVVLNQPIHEPLTNTPVPLLISHISTSCYYNGIWRCKKTNELRLVPIKITFLAVYILPIYCIEVITNTVIVLIEIMLEQDILNVLIRAQHYVRKRNNR